MLTFAPLMASMGYPEIIFAFICILLILFQLARTKRLGILPWILLNIPQIHKTVAEFLESNGSTFRLKGPWFFPIDILATADPANVHYVMSTNFANFPKGSELMKIFAFLGNGISNSDSDLWRNQRRVGRALISHSRFQKLLVKTSEDEVVKGLIPLIDHVSKQGLVVDLQDVFQRFSFDTACILITGFDPKSLTIELPEDPFSKAMHDVEEAILLRHLMPESLWKLQRWLGIGKEKKLKKAEEVLDHVIRKYISMKRKELEQIQNEPDKVEECGDMLTSFINDDEAIIEGFESDNKFLKDTILNLILAGRDTTSSSLTWFFWLLSKNPQVEAKIREELKAIIPSQEVGEAQKWRLFNVEEASKLVYLHGALCESLRLYPPVPFQHKSPLHPDTLPSGHNVHPKMKIVFPLYAMGRMTSTWGKDSCEFKPERWISETGKIKHEPSYKFMVFNAGPRTCIGKNVAFTVMKTAAANLIHNYHVQVVEGHPVVPNASIILYMKHGLKVRITKRWS